MCKEGVSEKELDEIINSMSDSDDGMDFTDDDSNVDENYCAAENYDSDDQSEPEDIHLEDGDVENHLQNNGNGDNLHNVLSSGQTNITTTPVSSTSKDVKSSILWRKKNQQIEDCDMKFTGNMQLPSDVMELEAPFDFFKYFFTDVINKIVEQSNLYALQKDVSRPANITETDLHKFIGICIYSSLMRGPNIRSH